MTTTIRALLPGEGPTIVAGGHLFDAPPDLATAERFLVTAGHHLLMAFVDEAPAGFVSGVELTHPDKGTEMFLYELAVDEPFRRRGIGTALVEALLQIARANGCYDLWVLTDHDNDAALATYRTTGTTDESSHVMLTWALPPAEPAR
ncbi:MAG TPA: GNAT family N-acetyltransferase [Candidatus Limnocylindrales bacterium]|nr:GNAT family N-acetyltransferase [Candidatus Limnocylindrales bacterium]